MWNQLTIRSRIIVATVLGLSLLGVVMGVIAYRSSSGLASALVDQTLLMKVDGDLHAAHVYLDRYLGGVSVRDGHLVDGKGAPIKDNSAAVDVLNRDLGVAFSIFERQGDGLVRVSTSVRDAEGKRVVGTRIGSDGVAYGPVTRGERYVGHSQVVGQPYLTAYEPLFDDAKNVVGMLGLGIPKAQAEAIVASGMRDLLLQMALALAGVLVIGVFGAVLLARMIAGPIGDVTARLRDIAQGEGDLRLRLQAEGSNELADLSRTFNMFADRIHALVRDVAGAASQMSSAAEQLSVTSGHTSDQVRRQLAETDQVATAIHEMTATVEEVARHASQAAAAATEANGEAEAGTQVVESTMSSIESLAGEVEAAGQVIARLSDDSRDIGAVLDVIRSVAAQTNLLALNAAIEAARAGEQGRGFAVVADEVRTLASRTQDSIQDIQDKIERVQTSSAGAVQVMDKGRGQAGQSVAQARQAGESLQSIERSITRINDMNTQIASAAEEQSAVAEEINRNIQSVVQVVHQIDKGAAQVASASGDLARLAAGMQELTGRFKV